MSALEHAAGASYSALRQLRNPFSLSWEELDDEQRSDAIASFRAGLLSLPAWVAEHQTYAGLGEGITIEEARKSSAGVLAAMLNRLAAPFLSGETG